MKDPAAVARSLLAQHGMTYSDLAAKVGASEATISRFMRGIHSPTMPMYCAIADAFGVSVDYLLGRTDVPLVRSSDEEEFAPLFAAYQTVTKRDRFLVRTILGLEEKEEYQ